MNEQLEFVKEIARRLDSAGIEYMITGSMAMVFYSVPRMTRDIDVVVHLKTAEAEKIYKLFSDDCYIDSNSVMRAIENSGVFNIIQNGTILKADFIIRKDEEYRKLEFSRKLLFDLEGQAVFLVSPEDLILSKLVWGKESNSDFQLRDITCIFSTMKDLDKSYIVKWVNLLGVAEDFRRILPDE